MVSTAHEDLALIRRMMEETRREVVERGRHFMIWGAVSSLGCLLTWLSLRGARLPNPGWMWMALLAAGWLASMLVGLRESRTQRVRTLGARVVAALWISTGVTLTLIGLSGIVGGAFGDVSPSGLIAVVIGAPMLVTAILTGESWLGWVAGGWWAGGTFSLFVPGPNTLLLLAAMTLLLMAVPGGVLYARARSGGGRELEQDAA